MFEPILHSVFCPGFAAISKYGQPETEGHRMAYWEWNSTGNPAHPHVVLCVHGLSRQGRDFDTLAKSLSQHARVICPDVVGRGQSDWLRDPSGYQIPFYAADILTLLNVLNQQAPISKLDWIGTSLGGLIALALCGQPGLPMPVAVRRLVLNDVGPVIQWQALQRIGTYLGRPASFDSLEAAAAMLASISRSFGPHTPQQWLDLSRHMVKPVVSRDGDAVNNSVGILELHYDPAIAIAFRSFTQEAAKQGEDALWGLYDNIRAETLLTRGAESDLLSRDTALQMARRGPHARLVEFDHVGHAPTLIATDQLKTVCDFIVGPDGSAAT